MADDLLSVLTRFHREVMLPDVERTVQDSVARVRDEVLMGIKRAGADLIITYFALEYAEDYKKRKA